MWVSDSGLEWPTSGSPVLDMTEVSDSTRSGWAMTRAWAIIPPIDTPKTCARSTPAASSTARASSAMSSIV